MPDVVIIGGGITGLAAARMLQVDACLFEKETRLGGCLRSDVIDGYTIDRTGHLLHFRDPYVRDVMYNQLSLEWNEFTRRAEVWIRNRSVPYPIQYNLHALPVRQRNWCLDTFLSRDSSRVTDQSSFEQWSRGSYGDGLHEEFFGPYNRKLWQVPLETMSAEWTERFVPKPDHRLILEGARAPHSTSDFGYNAKFSYPTQGGSQAIVEALAETVDIPIEKNAALVAIDPAARICEFSNGLRVQYRYLVSTIPLPSLVDKIHNAEDEIAQMAKCLRHNSVLYFAFGFKTSSAATNSHWIYVPEESFSMYRIGILSNYSPCVAPPGSVLVCAEIGTAPGQAPIDLHGLQARVQDDLCRIGVVKPDWQLELTHHGSIECAYVIFDKFRQSSLPRIHAYLESHGIYSVGRYGAWDYGSMGDALTDGRDCARLINGRLNRSPSSH